MRELLWYFLFESQRKKETKNRRLSQSYKRSMKENSAKLLHEEFQKYKFLCSGVTGAMESVSYQVHKKDE